MEFLKTFSPTLFAIASAFSPWDWAALFCCWPALSLYSKLALLAGGRVDSLTRANARSRMGWARALAVRPVGNRIMDASILATYNNSAVFFASSALLAMGAFLSFGISPERAKDAMEAAGAIAKHVEPYPLFLAKIATAAGFFGWAFLQFTWSMRQIAFACAIGGGIEDSGSGKTDEIEAFARLATQAGESFNNGLRAFYWSMAACCWLVSPGLCVFCSGLLAWGLWRREFKSSTLRAIARAYPPAATTTALAPPGPSEPAVQTIEQPSPPAPTAGHS
jgi:uncharacterized membrane protein